MSGGNHSSSSLPFPPLLVVGSSLECKGKKIQVMWIPSSSSSSSFVRLANGYSGLALLRPLRVTARVLARDFLNVFFPSGGYRSRTSFVCVRQHPHTHPHPRKREEALPCDLASDRHVTQHLSQQLRPQASRRAESPIIPHTHYSPKQRQEALKLRQAIYLFLFPVASFFSSSFRSLLSACSLPPPSMRTAKCGLC